MTTIKKYLLLPVLGFALMTGCVSQKKYKQQQAQLNEAQNAALMASADNRRLRDDSVRMTKKLMAMDEAIHAQADRLTHLDDRNDYLQKRLDKAKSLLNTYYSDLRVLQKNLSDALIEYPEDEISVYLENGMVHMQMANYMLFPSGSTELTDMGRKAVMHLAKLLQENPEMRVVVEGHADSIPVVTLENVEDNWDLSVLRATEVARQLEAAGIDPNRITPAGRSKFDPVADNATMDGRKANRRTEIILRPDLAPLYRHYLLIEENITMNK